MLWDKLNYFFPPLSTLREQWLLSLVSLVKPPADYFWKIRNLINQFRKNKQDLNLLHLLQTFDQFPQFQNQQIQILKKLNIQNFNLGIITNLFDQSFQLTENLQFIISELTLEQKENYWLTTKLHLNEENVLNKLSWCANFFENAEFSIRKKMADVLINVSSSRFESIIKMLIKPSEFLLLFPESNYKPLWKKSYKECLESSLAQFALEENSLQHFTIDEQIIILKNSLQKSEAKQDRLKIINIFLNHTSLDQVSFLNQLLNLKHQDELDKKILFLVLSGHSDFFQPTQSSLLASHYYSISPYHDLTDEFVEKNLLQRKDDFSEPQLDIPNKIQLFALDKLTLYFTEKITSHKRFFSQSKFSLSFGRFIQNNYPNRFHTPIQELQAIIDDYASNYQDPEQLKFLQKLLSLYQAKCNNKNLYSYEQQSKTNHEELMINAINLREEQRNFYIAVANGFLVEVSEQRLRELFPNECKDENAMNELKIRMRKIGCEVFDAKDKVALRAALGNHRLL